jgi:NYN domain
MIRVHFVNLERKQGRPPLAATARLTESRILEYATPRRRFFIMKREHSGPILSAVFVDYDNIYMSLRRKNEEAAKRFAKDAGAWVREIESGRLITSTTGSLDERPRRIVMNRCYGNPVPRRNANDSSTDMNSFPFIRHNFLRAGFETVDCPPLTAQLKNSADIRMVMDVRDLLTHDTYFDEFVILSGDADFTPVLHRLRAHARRTVIFANDFTAQPYTAICDGKVQESDLLNLLLEGRLPGQLSDAAPAVLTTSIQHEDVAREIIAEVVNAVRSASVPMPLEVLADRAIRALGHDRTIGSNWAGTGGFRDLLNRHLPEDVRMTEQPPYLAFETRRAVEAPVPVQRLEVAPALAPVQATPMQVAPAQTAQLQSAEPRFDRATFFASLPSASLIAAAGSAGQNPGQIPAVQQTHFEQQPLAVHIPAAPPVQQRPPVEAYAPQNMTVQAQQAQVSAQIASQAQIQQMRPAFDIPRTPATQSHVAAQNLLPQHADIAAYQTQFQQSAQIPALQPAPVQHQHAAPQQQPQQPQQRAPAQPRSADAAQVLQQSIARIHEACQAPPLSPPEYRVLFECMATEIAEQGLLGAQTLVNIVGRAQAYGAELRRDDVRFALEVVGEADPWFEQGASANLFAGRFRNYVVARCRGQGLTLTADELDLIDAWFAGVGQPQLQPRIQQPQQMQQPAPQPQMQPRLRQPTIAAPAAERWWNQTPEQAQDLGAAEEFPRIVKNRLRG